MNLEGFDVNWADDFDGAITVCDREGIIVYMNNYSAKQFEKYGGFNLMGSNLIDCHPEPSKSKLKAQLKHPANNCYTTEKKGIKTIIYQTPWKYKGEFKGMVEISFDFEKDTPHFIRD